MEQKDRYLLREAGGVFWLIDTAQPGVPYRAPLGMNESGACIWKLAREGLAPEEIAARLAGAEASEREALADVRAFLAQLRQWLKEDSCGEGNG